MLPYSLGHELILLQQRNPLMYSGFESLHPEFQKVAIKRAVSVCARNWIQNQKSDPFFNLWSWRVRNYNFALSIADWNNYRAAGSASPPTESVEYENGSRSLGAPLSAAMIQFLIQNMGLTEARAYDYPIGLCKFHYYTNAEREGGIKIINAAELSFEEYCRKEDEKAAQLKGSPCPA